MAIGFFVKEPGPWTPASGAPHHGCAPAAPHAVQRRAGPWCHRGPPAAQGGLKLIPLPFCRALSPVEASGRPQIALSELPARPCEARGNKLIVQLRIMAARAHRCPAEQRWGRCTAGPQSCAHVRLMRAKRRTPAPPAAAPRGEAAGSSSSSSADVAASSSTNGNGGGGSSSSADALAASSSTNGNGGAGAGAGRDLQQRLDAAYQAGHAAGYAKGVAVTVNVDVDLSGSGLAGSPGSAGSGKQAAKACSSGGGGGGKDTLVRSMAKGVVWRLFSTSVTVAVAVALLGDALAPGDLFRFGGAEFAAKLVMYVVFERLWQRL